LKRDDLDEVTSQPLLNYLVALSYEGGKINFSQEVSLNTIYHDLLDRIYERGWEDNRNPAVGKLDAGEFARVLEEIALAVWHGKGRTTTVKKIEEHCQAGGLTRLLDVFQEGAKSGITRLLTAFYFRESGTEGEDRAFEFTHKSFGEYLTARRLARMTRRIDQELARKKGSYDEGWDERDALKHLVDLCGPTPIDDYLLRFIRLEFALAERDEAKNWQESYVALTNAMLQAGMPMELLPERRSFLHEMKQARNAKTALMLLLNAAARVTKQISSIRWPNPSSAGELFRELVEPDGPRLTRTDLSLLDVSGCWLQGMSGHATFHASSLAGANLAAGMFIICDFSEAKMSKIHAAFTSFVYCNFDGADLSQANFDQTRWTKSILKKALLRGVRCEDGDFKDAELRAAEFNNAKLTRCDFRGANLTGASFAGARLKNCDFTGAKITNINLKGCKRTDVKGLIRRRRTK
jgi:uncharacterized protein YjbI with pentapeptide repeats